MADTPTQPAGELPAQATGPPSPPPAGLTPPVAPAEGRIGAPIALAHGQFAGQTVRFELAEVQQAEVGRKLGSCALYSRKDRRPIDPPPIVQCRVFRVVGEGDEEREEELLCNDVRAEGIVCYVDLYTESSSQDARPPANDTPAAPSSSSSASSTTLSVKVTEQLAGSTFAQLRVGKLHGRTALIFAFPDLSVRSEGVFWPRYRCFDLFSSLAGTEGHPVLAECTGGRFKLYSTNEFPGLAASTGLTQEINTIGVRTHHRTSVRKRRPAPQSEAQQGSAPFPNGTAERDI